MSTVEKAKEIRKELKLKFKGVKFSVRTKKYSGGSSISVSWVDFPTVEAVEEITSKYESVRYDEYTGEVLCGGNTFVFTNNSWSDDMKENIRENLIIKYGIEFYNEYIENSYDGFRYEKEAYKELYKKSLEVAADTEEKEEPKAEDKKVLYSNEEVQIIEKGKTTRIYFNGKPSEETRNSIKALGFRFFKNDGFYWGIYSNKTTLEAIKEALQVEDVEEIENTIEDLKQVEQVEQVEEVKNIKEEKTDQILFDIYGEGIREDKEDLTLEELEKEFNARVEDERIYQEEYGKGGYCKTWIIAKYKGIKYKTCRIDLIGNEDLYISLSDTINDVMLGLKNNCSDSLEYYFNSSDFNKCIELIQNLINLLKSKIENKEQTHPKENKFEIIEGTTEATEEGDNIQRINNIYSEVEALENRLKLVKSNKLKYKLQDQINRKMKEIAKIILSDEILYLQFMKESKE